MNALSRRGALTVGLAAGLAGGLGLALAGPQALAAAEPAAGDISVGSPKAPVHVVEYLSVTCPHCAHFNADVFPTLKAKYIDTGQVRWTFREMLTAPGNVAAAGFLMARCAGPSKYVKVVDEVLRSQPRWQSGNIKPIFLEIAQANGLTEAQFEACLTDPKGQEALQQRLMLAQKDEVTGTPTFFVNGKHVGGPGVPDLADMEVAIAQAAKGGRR